MTFKEALGDSSSRGTTHCALNSRKSKTSTQHPFSLNAVNLIAPFIQSDNKSRVDWDAFCSHLIVAGTQTGWLTVKRLTLFVFCSKRVWDVTAQHWILLYTRSLSRKTVCPCEWSLTSFVCTATFFSAGHLNMHGENKIITTLVQPANYHIASFNGYICLAERWEAEAVYMLITNMIIAPLCAAMPTSCLICVGTAGTEEWQCWWMRVWLFLMASKPL